jgi:glycosyltransferase involved in cell wall biosynthesis
MGEPAAPRPTVAIVAWGDAFDLDFLDGLGLDIDQFAREMTGGWMFGYVDALARAGVRTVIVLHAARVRVPRTLTHAGTGATIHVLPTPAAYLRLRRYFADMYSWRRTGRASLAFRALLPLSGSVFLLTAYLATARRELEVVLAREGCDAILCQEYEDARFDLCVRLGARLGIPVFGTYQGGNFQRIPLERPIRRRSIRRAAGLVIASAAERHRVAERYGVAPARIATVLNPLDVALWHRVDGTAARQALGIPAGATVIAWHGRVDIHVKGLDVLLDAWARVHAAARDTWLLLIGSGADAAALRGRVEQLPGITWVNEYVLDRPRMRSMLSAADIYALSSRHEGFAVAPLEAMACGLPIVATDVPGIRDVLADGEASGGIVVPIGDADALAAGLRRLIDDPALRRTLAVRARQRAEEAFSPDAVGAALRHVLIDTPARSG